MIDKKNPTIFQMIIVLLAIAVVCSAGVAAVYNATKDTIAAQKAQKEQDALKKVLPAYDNDPIADKVMLDGGLECYVAKNGADIVGYAVKASNTDGYNGLVEVLTGFMPNGDIINTQATVLAETPGLGQKAVEPAFHDQFNGKNPGSFNLSVKKDGGSVDAITAATITSRAYSKCVKTAYDALMQYVGKTPSANSGANASAN